ncbi:sensor histidine kinase [Pedobacter arcticus]|uniref:sensor histidine kinase n=1 Tax=Pedobacter arcticus TaxID=752140 RepID=UPI0002D511BD|nr:HAMP domain-containing sensor histidine kinase [Pedobacter arcticus]
MKLLNYTSKYLLILLVPLITIWAVIFYYALLDEIYDSLDDGLENQKVMVLEHPELIESAFENQNFKKGNHVIEKIGEQEYHNFEESYRDSLMYMQNEKDYEPVRVFESTFKDSGAYYKIKIITSMVEEDDLIKNLATYLIILYLLILISIVSLNNFVLRKIWKPFYSLIDQLKSFRIENETTLKINKTDIDEFELLNQTMEQLTEKSRKSYLNQKHFIENASHELQTPLAISINKLELFSEKNDLTEEQLKDVGFVLDNLARLTRLNKSLLLLSKIENQQFVEVERVDFESLVNHIAQDFEDLLLHKGTTLNIVVKNELQYQMNKDLAIIMLTNLMKNAIVHGVKQGTINIVILGKQLILSNYGVNHALDDDKLFSRFEKMNTDSRSTGLGLAIAKAITQKYQLQLNYTYSTIHNFIVVFP